MTRNLNLHGHYVAVAHTGDLEHDYIGVWDTEQKARASARMHFNDTGQMVDVLRLSVPARVITLSQLLRACAYCEEAADAIEHALPEAAGTQRANLQAQVRRRRRLATALRAIAIATSDEGQGE